MFCSVLFYFGWSTRPWFHGYPCTTRNACTTAACFNLITYSLVYIFDQRKMTVELLWSESGYAVLRIAWWWSQSVVSWGVVYIQVLFVGAFFFFFRRRAVFADFGSPIIPLSPCVLGNPTAFRLLKASLNWTPHGFRFAFRSRWTLWVFRLNGWLFKRIK